MLCSGICQILSASMWPTDGLWALPLELCCCTGRLLVASVHVCAVLLRGVVLLLLMSRLWCSVCLGSFQSLVFSVSFAVAAMGVCVCVFACVCVFSVCVFHLRGSGEKAWDRLQRACVISQRIQWPCSP